MVTFNFIFQKIELQVASARMFALMDYFSSILLIAIAMIFLKNQTSPIINLS